MITLPELAAEALGAFLASDMKDRFGASHARLAELVPFAARLALECIGNSDALYHNVEHTMLVTLAGHDIFKGRALLLPSTPSDYSNFIVACLTHDIGYVRGVCRGDRDGQYVINAAGEMVSVPDGATDASMTPYHVARSKLFVRERFGKVALVHLDTSEIEANIEHTRFPVPGDEPRAPTDDFPGLLRAADLIGQLADINYLRKTAALFNEFRETGTSKILKYNSAADLRANYPQFFWKAVNPYIGEALRYLRVTQEGQQWVANLYANVFATEHRGQIS